MYRSWIALGESVLRFHGQIEPMLYYAGHNCVLPKPRDRRLPADVWVPLGDAGERARSPSVASRPRLTILPPVASLLFLSASTTRRVTLIVSVCQVHHHVRRRRVASRRALRPCTPATPAAT